MLFKSSLLAQASGSVGGSTYSRNRGGMYIRNRSVPTNPNTGAQAAVRANMAMCSQAWMLITDVQRQSWATYAANVAMKNRLGDTIFLTGQQMFLRTNCVRVQASLPPIANGPTTYNLGELGDFVAEAPDVSMQSIELNFDDSMEFANHTGDYLVIWVSRPVAPSINYFKGPFNYADVLAGSTLTPMTSPVSTVPPVAPITLGNKLFVKVAALYHDGRMTNSQIIETPPAVA